ncbi:unnamed protein product [Trifolium pratense]|uniref:Uncharacterized protein n=1 Tax=Trifolium pratense TaxID=57577 RepID=A0ACB0IYI5_TRIPR|nr:unnamed protein product [Trifolium pratense]
MASLVLLLSFLVRTTKTKNQDSIVSSKSFDTIEDDSCLNAKWTHQREWSMEENIILHESKVCIYLV